MILAQVGRYQYQKICKLERDKKMKNNRYQVIGKFMCNGEEYITVRFLNAAMSMKKTDWVRIRNAIKN